jgi:hypothetical protein
LFFACRFLSLSVFSLFISRKVLEHENQKLRKTIDVYIRSAELNDPVWEIMNNEEISPKTGIASSHRGGGGGGVGRQRPGTSGFDDDASTNEEKEKSSLGFKRKDIIDEGRKQLKNLNRLDIEINEILTNSLKEENRQRLLLKDLMKLVMKNKDALFTAATASVPSVVAIPTEGELVSAISAAGVSKEDTAAMILTIQKLSSSTKSSTVARIPVNTKASFHAGAAIQSFLSTAAAGMNLWGSSSKLVDTVDIGIQIDDKDELGLTTDNPDDHQKVDVFSLGVAPLAPSNTYFPGLDFPYLLRKKMSTFPNVLRVPPVAWACQLILSVYLDKLESDKDRMGRNLPKLSLPDHIYDYFLRCYGLNITADVQVALLLKACEAHIKKQSRISLFASQIGLLAKEDLPNMDVKDTDFILHTLACLVSQGELQSDAQKSSKKRNSAHLAVYIRPDINRNAAVNTVFQIFDKWLPDGGEEAAIKIRSLQQSDLGSRYVVSYLSISDAFFFLFISSLVHFSLSLSPSLPVLGY